MLAATLHVSASIVVLLGMWNLLVHLPLSLTNKLSKLPKLDSEIVGQHQVSLRVILGLVIKVFPINSKPSISSLRLLNVFLIYKIINI